MNTSISIGGSRTHASPRNARSMSIARRVDVDLRATASPTSGTSRSPPPSGARDLEHLARGQLEQPPDRPHAAIAVVHRAALEVLGPPLVVPELGGATLAVDEQLLAAQRLGGRRGRRSPRRRRIRRRSCPGPARDPSRSCRRSRTLDRRVRAAAAFGSRDVEAAVEPVRPARRGPRAATQATALTWQRRSRVDDVDEHALPVLDRRRLDDGAQRRRGAAAAADHVAVIVRRRPTARARSCRRPRGPR